MTGRLPRLTVAAGLMFLLLLACIPASAQYPRSMTSELTGDLQGLTLVSTVDKIGSSYLYTYELSYATGNLPVVHEFGVQNPLVLPFSNAANSGLFTNPTYPTASTWISWIDSNLPSGSSVTFSYQSPCAESEIPFVAYALNGGGSAVGEAYGMVTMIPEPSALAGLAFGLLGMAPRILRKRR